MRPRRSHLKYAQDILEWALRAESHLGTMSYEDFVADKKTIDAAVLALITIGEAAGKVPAEYKKRYPGIPWRNIISSRHQFVHDYPNTTYARVYDMVRYELRPMYPHLQKLIQEIEEDEA